MPRPKRTKVAPSVPTSRVATVAPLTNLPTQQRNHSSAPAERVATTSDDSEGIVTTSTTLKNRWGVEKRDVFMSGGLGTGDKQNAHPKPGVTRPKAAKVDTARVLEQAKAIDGLKKRREAALAAQKVSVVEVPSSIPASGAEDAGLAAVGKDSEAMSRAKGVTSETGSKTQEAPGADASILALANFKRRPRQPSILQTFQQDSGATDDDLYDVSDAEDDKRNAVDQVEHSQPEDESEAQGTPGAEVSILALANFKRRPRQPSILQVPIQQGVGNADDDDLHEDDGDGDQIGDFQPEDESTPFIVSKTQPHIEAILSPSPSSPTPESQPGSSSKKRKLTPVEVQVPRSSPPEVQSSPSEGHQHIENYNPPVPHDYDQESPSEQPEAHSDREHTPQIWSDTLAPPLSSSPSQTPHSPPYLELSTRPPIAHTRRKQPARKNHALANRSDSPTKRSNLPPKTRTHARQSLSTATLQTLLPRRRTRARPSTFDIPSSDNVGVRDDDVDTSIHVNDDDDDDELSHAPAKKPGGKKRATQTASAAAAVSKKPSPLKKNRAAATAAATRPSRKSAAAAKKATAATAVGVGKAPSTKTTRTYTRRVVSEKDRDKENADPNPGPSRDGPRDDDETLKSGEEEGRGDVRLRIGGPELERAARWFREVEKWELEFEEVTGSSDSMMRDAR